MPPGLPDDPLHATINLLRWRTAVVHRKLDEQEVGFVLQNIMLEPEHSQVGAGSTNGRVDLAYPGNGELLAKPGECLRPPAILRGDAAAQIGDTHFAARPEFG